MAGILPLATPCCTPCPETEVSQVPGPSGSDGADGVDGAAGVSAFTTTTADFLMPAEGASVTVSVANSTWIATGQNLYVQTAGYLKVTAVPTSTSVTLQNPENTGTGVYADNVAPSTSISSGVKVSPGGLQGPAGAGAAGQLLAANNLSDVASAATSRSNLGLGTVAVQAASGVNITGGVVGVMTNVAVAATIRTDLGVQPLDADLTAIAALVSAADMVPYSTGAGTWSLAAFTAAGRALVAAADAATQRTLLGVMTGQGLLGSLVGANFNSTADQAINITGLATAYIIRKIVVCNASISLTTAVGGVYAAGAKTTPIVANTQVYTALTAPSKFVDLTLTALAQSDTFQATPIYLSLSTPQGVAATADILIFGDVVE